MLLFTSIIAFLIWVLCRFLSLPFGVMRMKGWWHALRPCFWRRASASLSLGGCSSCLQPLSVFKSVEFLGLYHWPRVFTGAALHENSEGNSWAWPFSGHGRNSWGLILFSPAQQLFCQGDEAAWPPGSGDPSCQLTVVFKSWFNGLAF